MHNYAVSYIKFLVPCSVKSPVHSKYRIDFYATRARIYKKTLDGETSQDSTSYPSCELNVCCNLKVCTVTIKS